MGFEGASSRSMFVLFGLIAAGGITFFIVAGTGILTAPFRDVDVGGTMTEQVTIVHVANGQCIVDTSDTALSAKIIQDCDMAPGTQVTVMYEPASRYAWMVTP